MHRLAFPLASRASLLDPLQLEYYLSLIGFPVLLNRPLQWRVLIFVYHEVHEDPVEFYNVISLCVLRAFRDDISLLL